MIRILDEQLTKQFFVYADEAQRTYYPADLYEGELQQIDHRLRILAEDNPRLLEDISPTKLMERQQAMGPYKKAMFAKENAGKLTWTLALYGTAGMAQEANMSVEEYREQIINACFLEHADPIATWTHVEQSINTIKAHLNSLDIQRIHMVGEDCDIHIALGEHRSWLGGS